MIEPVRQHVDQAVAFLGENKLPQAAAEFEAAVRTAPQDVTLRQRLADVYLRMGLPAHAVRELQHVAGRYARDGELFKAIAINKVILELSPDHKETQAALAGLYATRLETAPFHSPLPAAMSGALAGARETAAAPRFGAPIDLESLAVFRSALEGFAPLPRPHPDGRAHAVSDQLRATSIDVASLPRSPLFSALDEGAFAAVIEQLDLRWMTAGETLLREGDGGDSMFVVVQGAVNVLREGLDEDRRLLAVLTEGSFFGEMALVTDSPRLATVVAASDGLLFQIDRQSLLQIAAVHPAVRDVVEEFYSDRLLANLLRASPLFRPFPLEDKRAIADRFTRLSLPPDATILEQGQHGIGLCVLLRGRCDVLHEAGHGDRRKLQSLREGDVFGEISTLLDRPCTATVRTSSYCEVLQLPVPDFRELVLPNAEVRALIQRLVDERLQSTAGLSVAADIHSDYLV